MDRPGWQTTEFWMSLILALTGAWLIAHGREELGTVLMTAAGGPYALGRSLVKARAPETPSPPSAPPTTGGGP